MDLRLDKQALSTRRKLLLLLIFSLFTGNMQAQDQAPNAGFGEEGNFLGGQIIRHKITTPVPEVSTALDANFTWHTTGKKDWQQRRHFPTIGVGMTYVNYGNNAVFGQCLGIYPNLEITILRRKDFDWTFRFGDGLGYVTRKYQTTAPLDTLNTAIGSNLNDFAMFMTDIRYHLDDHWQLQFGANFTHISNADYHQPNLGINLAGAHIGIRYYPSTYKTNPTIRKLPDLKNRWLVQLRYGMAYNESRSPGNPILPTYVGSAYISKRWMSKNKVFLGTDYSYSKPCFAFLQWCQLFKGHEGAHSWDGAVFIGNEFLLGRVGLMAQAGVYYQQIYLRQDPVYQKFGINYYILKNEHGIIKELFVSALLKTHLIIAEFAEFGIGTGF